MPKMWALIAALFLVTMGLMIPDALSASATTTTTSTTTTTTESNPNCQLNAALGGQVVMEDTLNDCTFSDADFDGISVETNNFIGTTWNNLQAIGTQFAGNNFSSGIFQGGNFSGAHMLNENFVGANFSTTNFTDANFEYSNLTDANLAGVNLSGAELSQATLTGVLSNGIKGVPASLPTGWTISKGVLLGPEAAYIATLPSNSCEAGLSNQSHNLEVDGSGSKVTVSFWRTSQDVSLGIVKYKIYVGETGSGEPNESRLPFFATSCDPLDVPESSGDLVETAYFPNSVHTLTCSSINSIKCQNWYFSEPFSKVPNGANQVSVLGYDAQGNVIAYMYGAFNQNLAAAQIKLLGIPLPFNQGQLCHVAALGLPIAQTVYVADNLALSLLSNIPGPVGQTASFGSSLVSEVAVAAGVNGDGDVAITVKQKITLSSNFLKGYTQDKATDAVKAALDQAVESETGAGMSNITLKVSDTGVGVYQVVSTIRETIGQTETLINAISGFSKSVARNESVCAALYRR